MKLLYFISLAALVLSASCPVMPPFNETEAGEFAYALCDDGEWGYRVNYCTSSSNPIWMKIEDICTSKKELIHPPFGSNMMEWKFEIENFDFPELLPKHIYDIDAALFNITYEYEVKPIDVVVIDVEKTNSSFIITVHERVDFVYRSEVIDWIKDSFKNGTALLLLTELNDDFLGANLKLQTDSFHWNSFNILYNFYWDCLIGIIIITIIWYYICKCGRKNCEKKAKAEAEKKALLEGKTTAVSFVCLNIDLK